MNSSVNGSKRSFYLPLSLLPIRMSLDKCDICYAGDFSFKILGRHANSYFSLTAAAAAFSLSLEELCSSIVQINYSP